MAKKIFKYDLSGPNPVNLRLPKYSKFLFCDFQQSQLMAWFLIDTICELEDRDFYIYGTGHVIPYEVKYLGSGRLELESTNFVLHVFEDNGMKKTMGHIDKISTEE